MSNHYLGKTMRCTVTGMTGVVTAYTVHLNGSVECRIETRCTSKTHRPNSCWLHSQRLELVEPDK